MGNILKPSLKVLGVSCMAALGWAITPTTAQAGSEPIDVITATSNLSAGCASVAAYRHWPDTDDTLSITQNFFAGEVLTFSGAAPTTSVNIEVDGSIVVAQTATPAAVSYVIATTGSQQVYFVWTTSGSAATVSVSCTSSAAATAGNVVNATTAQAQGTQIIGAVFSHLNSLSGMGGGLSGEQAGMIGDTPIFSLSGLSAGDKPLGGFADALWISASYTGTKNTAAGSTFDGDMINVQMGMDYQLNEDVVTGLSVGIGDADLKNVAGAGGTYKETSLSVAPYAQIKFEDMYTIGVTAGYAWGSVDQVNAGSGASGKSDSTMMFVATRGGADFDINESTQITGRISGAYVSKSIAGFTDSLGLINSSTGQSKVATLSIGSEVRHNIITDDGNVTPYLGADLMRDYKSAINNDTSALNLSYGLRGEGSGGFFYTIDGSSQMLRSKFSSYTFGGRMGINF